MLFSLGEAAVISVKSRNKILQPQVLANPWYDHRGSIPTGSIPPSQKWVPCSQSDAVCHSQILDLFSQPHPSFEPFLPADSGGLCWWRLLTHALCPSTPCSSCMVYRDATMKCYGSKNVIIPCWQLEKIIAEFLGFFKAGSSISLPRVI